MEHDDPLGYRARLAAVTAHIQANLQHPISLEELARVACFSPYHFHRVFSAMTGETLGQHLRRLRLDQAALQLERTAKTVTQLALEAGYEAPGSFCRAFKARFGENPAAFRVNSRDRRARGLPVRTVPGRDPDLNLLRQRGTLAMLDVSLQKKPALRVAAARHVGPYDQCEAAWAKLCGWAGPKGLIGPGTRFLGIGYDDPGSVEPEKLRYDACLTVGPEIGSDGEIRVFEIPGGEYAVAVHKGPYTGLKQAYDDLYGRWLPQSGREPAAHMGYELYLNDPASTAPEELLTELNLPLAPVKG